jgi:hypothetical protein
MHRQEQHNGNTSKHDHSEPKEERSHVVIVEKDIQMRQDLYLLRPVHQLTPSKNWYFVGTNCICSRNIPLFEKRQINNEVVEASSEMLLPSTLDI